MTSVPLGFWPDNLSSLAWLGVIIFLLSNQLIGIQYAANGIIMCIALFILDQLILGPFWYWKVR
jgi:hypothetical protein